jgi:hypothetical protein
MNEIIGAQLNSKQYFEYFCSMDGQAASIYPGRIIGRLKHDEN